EQVAERPLQLGDDVLGEAAAHQADGVRAVDAGRAAADRARVRQRVLGHHRIAADERMPSNAAELMHARAGADVDEILDRDMAAGGGHVADDRVVADVAVVGDVDVAHEQVAITDSGHAATAVRAAVDGDELAEDVLTPDRQPRLLASILQILRRLTDRREWIDLAVVADVGPPLDDRRGADAAVRADPRVRADDRVRTDAGARADLGAGMNERAWIDLDGVGNDAEEQLRLGDDLIADVGRRPRAGERRPPASERHLEAESIARHD